MTQLSPGEQKRAVTESAEERTSFEPDDVYNYQTLTALDCRASDGLVVAALESLDRENEATALREAEEVTGQWAIAGKSYGGYLSSWAVGHTDLFAAAVVIAPVGNIETHYGTSDSGYYADPYSMNGGPTINRERMRQLSPSQHAQVASTATLLLQGEEDKRCPRCQGEELFVSIKRCASAACELVLYPGASHSFTSKGRPSHRRDVVARTLAWLLRWTTKDEAGKELPRQS